MPPFRGVVGGADDGDGPRIEQGTQVADRTSGHRAIIPSARRSCPYGQMQLTVGSIGRAMATQVGRKLDRERIAELTAREQKRLDQRTPQSRALYERARDALAGGVAS